MPATLTSIDSLLAQVTRLPVLPQGLVKLLSLDPAHDSFCEAACTTIRADAALTAQILRLANSARFSGQTPCTTVERAFMRVGSRTLVSTMIEGHLVQVFNTRDPGFGLIWTMGSLSGSLARTLAESRSAFGILPEEAATIGLLHDIGYFVLLTLYPDEAWDVMRECLARAGDPLAVEKERLGVTHDVVGKLLATYWNLPPLFGAVIGNHHRRTAAIGVEYTRYLDLIEIVDDVIQSWMQAPGDRLPDADDLQEALSGRRDCWSAFRLSFHDLAAALATARDSTEKQRLILDLPPTPLTVAGASELLTA
jgi:HD-like signal output (HDOD) protein